MGRGRYDRAWSHERFDQGSALTPLRTAVSPIGLSIIVVAATRRLQSLARLTDEPEEKDKGGQVLDPPKARQGIDQYAQQRGARQVGTGHRLCYVGPQR